jgi:hypothetical protein
MDDLSRLPIPPLGRCAVKGPGTWVVTPCTTYDLMACRLMRETRPKIATSRRRGRWRSNVVGRSMARSYDGQKLAQRKDAATPQSRMNRKRE